MEFDAGVSVRRLVTSGAGDAVSWETTLKDKTWATPKEEDDNAGDGNAFPNMTYLKAWDLMFYRLGRLQRMPFGIFVVTTQPNNKICCLVVVNI